MNILQKTISRLLEKPIVKHAKDVDRVRSLFSNGNCLFNVDRDNGHENSSFAYFRGACGVEYSLSGLGEYLLRYGRIYGYDLNAIAEEYANFVKDPDTGIAYANEEIRHKLVSAWASPSDKVLDLNSKYSSCHLEFCAYFLFDKLALPYALTKL